MEALSLLEMSLEHALIWLHVLFDAGKLTHFKGKQEQWRGPRNG